MVPAKPCWRLNWVRHLTNQILRELNQKPRDCTVSCSGVTDVQSRCLPGIQYSMQRQNVPKSRPKKARSGAPATGSAGKKLVIQRRGVPSAVSQVTSGTTARVVKHVRRELVQGVTIEQGGFVLADLNEAQCLLHPGNQKLFPWMSSIAPAYEKYRFTQCAMVLESSAPTTASGFVYLAFDTDPVDARPTSVGDMMANAMSSSGTVWEGCSLKLDCAAINQGIPWRYTASIAANEPRTTYAGSVLVAGSGLSGEFSFNLILEYTLEFSVEQPPYARAQETYSTWVTPTSGWTTPVSLNTTFRGPLRVVQGASAPVFTGIPIELDTTSPSAYDFTNLSRGLGRLTLDVSGGTPTPQTLLESLTRVEGLLMNSDGSFLDTLSSVGCPVGSGPFDLSLRETPGAKYISNLTFSISQLLSAYPTARYIIPVVMALTEGSVSKRFGMRFH